MGWLPQVHKSIFFNGKQAAKVKLIRTTLQLMFLIRIELDCVADVKAGFGF